MRRYKFISDGCRRKLE